MSQQNPDYDPNAGKVKLYNMETGEVIERWPVDAREIVAAGGWAYTPDGSTEQPNLPRSPSLG
ncbi:MAG TPA: hypothetical protein VJU82_13635 [Acidobacteriaceae bacterium]|nr:hypothetical protein [Acidobacteriaceae bacterium]